MIPEKQQDGFRYYNRWSGNPKGTREDVTRCVVSISGTGRGMMIWQCRAKRGHGPNGEFCKRHAPLTSVVTAYKVSCGDVLALKAIEVAKLTAQRVFFRDNSSEARHSARWYSWFADRDAAVQYIVQTANARIAAAEREISLAKKALAEFEDPL